MADLYLYDTSLAPLPASTTGISVYVTDVTGYTITATVGSLLVGFGATYTQSGQHAVFVRDTSGTYCAAHLAQMNGSQNYRVDLVLMPPPIAAGSGGTVSAGDASAVGRFLARQTTSGVWTEHQARGVAGMVALANYVRMLPARDVLLQGLVDEVAEILHGLGIVDA